MDNKLQNKGILFLNGEGYCGQISQENSYTICCDGALGWAKKWHIDLHIGDFDSTIEKLPQNRAFSRVKDCTDGELGLRMLIEHGCREIEIYGGGGRREDHQFGNLQLLFYAYKRGIMAKMITNYCTIYCCNGKIQFKEKKNKTISIAPFMGDVHIVDSEGLQYPLKDTILYADECRGMSNIIQKQKASITVKSGYLLVFEVDKII